VRLTKAGFFLDDVKMFGWGAEAQVVYPECESPITHEEIQALGEKKFQEFISLCDGPGWTKVNFSVADIQVFTKSTSDSNLYSQKAIGELSGSPFSIAEKAFCTDDSIVKKFDRDIKQIKVLKVESQDIVLYQSQHTTPFPVTHREFVAFRFRKITSDGTYYVWGTSVNNKDVPQSSGHVRGVISVSGWILRPVEGNPNLTNCTRIFRIDPKGNIPTIVVNMYSTKSGNQLVEFRNYLTQS